MHEISVSCCDVGRRSRWSTNDRSDGRRREVTVKYVKSVERAVAGAELKRYRGMAPRRCRSPTKTAGRRSARGAASTLVASAELGDESERSPDRTQRRIAERVKLLARSIALGR